MSLLSKIKSEYKVDKSELSLLDYLERQDGEELTTTYDLITGFILYEQESEE